MSTSPNTQSGEDELRQQVNIRFTQLQAKVVAAKRGSDHDDLVYPLPFTATEIKEVDRLTDEVMRLITPIERGCSESGTDELLSQIWRVYEESGGNGNNFLSGQAMAMATFIHQRESALLDAVREKAIDLGENISQTCTKHDCADCQNDGKNGLRADQRAALSSVAKEHGLTQKGSNK